MHLPELLQSMAATALLVLPCAPLAALDVDQLNWIETREEWGQVLFCQRIYKMAEVKPRLYSFDIEHCDKAAQLMTDVVAKYAGHERVLLKNQAEQHALALSYNTSEPYHSVAACRAYCRDLAEIKDQRND
jgi:hypothetical protein